VITGAHRPIHAEEIDGLDTETATDDATRRLLEEYDVQLVIPLISGEHLRGFILLGPKPDGSLYNESDVGNLHTFSVQAAALVEIVRLHRESLARKQLETELSVARRIQGNLVPRKPLRVSGARLHGRMDPSREVGGDYFDYFPLDGDRVGFAIADVTGKGVPAALLMTSLRVAFRSAAARLVEPADVVASLDRTIADMGEAALLVCFFYGIYDPATRRLVYSNAGMTPPLLLREGRDYVERLKKGGLMLGIDPEVRHQSGILELGYGDLLALYTDGFDEQPDPAGEFFGEERVVQALMRHRGVDLETLCERIFATVEAWGGPDRSDDRTLMLLQVNRLDETD
jgi:sigma-B regulation protein RsbU (phosphoserine phosphatase)